MPKIIDRRGFLAAGAALATGVRAQGVMAQDPVVKDPRVQGKPASRPKQLFRISLAQWSLHNRFYGRTEPKLDNLDFAKTASGLGITAIEYVNRFFGDNVAKEDYLAELKKRADAEGVRSLLIMCDGLGALGAPKQRARTQAVERHVPWLVAAKVLGCHSIRVNAVSRGSYQEQMKLTADGLAALATKGAQYGLNVIVENHGGLSSNGGWLAGVMKKVGMPNCGTLPDFGNFRLADGEWYDRYKGVTELMPFAKAVSAKSHDFDDDGNETRTDYLKMMKIVVRAGYRGFVGIEYEGLRLDEMAGILATKKLLLRVHAQLLAAKAAGKQGRALGRSKERR
ncbi:MAG: xylose isomerase [Planctomycetes bacterium]|jgi:sugar phosphate isomerase/epimerase|nr:xylose isomerase [Planctomycetota bacterium]MDP6423284.1 sugar phosphate isomerase/epimerase family protein [Planctomycetota bacterium]